MMTYRDWVLSALNDPIQHREIDGAEAMGDTLIEVRSTDGKIITVGVLDGQIISADDVREICKSGARKPNIIVSKKDSIWNGSAISYSRRNNVGWGGIGEINYALHTDNYGCIQKKEYNFVEEGLSQHTRVKSLERLYDRVFKIHRIGGLSPITVVLINSYELSGEEVRNAKRKYKLFEAILKTNPNGDPTSNAYSIAGEIGAEIFKWGELLGRLNKK